MDTIEVNGKRLPIERRFWKRVSKNKNSECLIWTGSFYPNGYGRFNYNNIRLGAHRISYMLNTGHIDTGNVIHHICNNKQCVNPKHLESITSKQNIKKYYDGY